MTDTPSTDAGLVERPSGIENRMRWYATQTRDKRFDDPILRADCAEAAERLAEPRPTSEGSGIPTAMAEQACTISKSGSTVRIECDEADEANELFEWLSGLADRVARPTSEGSDGLVERVARIVEASLKRHDVSEAYFEGTLDDAEAILTAVSTASPARPTRVWNRTEKRFETPARPVELSQGVVDAPLPSTAPVDLYVGARPVEPACPVPDGWTGKCICDPPCKPADSARKWVPDDSILGELGKSGHWEPADSAEREAGFREGIEAAAKVAERWPDRIEGAGIAERIRALATKETGK